MMFRRNSTWPARFTMLATLLALSICTLACMKLDNPVELETDGDEVSGGMVKVNVFGIDAKATILEIDLSWEETGAEEPTLYKKTMPLDGQSTELSLEFDDLPLGIGQAGAASFLGLAAWQERKLSRQLEMSSASIETVDIGLDAPTTHPDGDRDLADGDAEEQAGDGDVQSDGDLEDDQEPDLEAESEGEEEQPTEWIVDVRYRAVPSDINGRLNLSDNEVGWNEWPALPELSIETAAEIPTTVFLMQDGAKLMLGLNIPSLTSDDELIDRVRFAFDVDISKADDEFILTIWRGSPLIRCETLAVGGCGDLPSGRPDAYSNQSEITDGWQVELSLDYTYLGLVAGVSKSLGFALLNVDNGSDWSWPTDGLSINQAASWGRMQSSDLWDETEPVDGDEDLDRDPDRDPEQEMEDGDAELADGDLDQSDADEIEDDPDLEPERDPDEEDGDVEPEEDIEQICDAGDIICEQQGPFHFSRTCNNAGTAYAARVDCNDYVFCTQDICIEDIGCYNDNQGMNGTLCNDGLNCTEDDQCTGGLCRGTDVVCEESPCSSWIKDGTNPACCVYTYFNDDDPCEDGYECSNSTCQSSICTLDWIPGCCQGHPDMQRVVENETDYCIDRYESVIGDQTYFIEDGCSDSGGGGQRYGLYPGTDDYPAGFPDDVTPATQTDVLYACSVAGNVPSRNMTWDQAFTACANSGKRLCDLAEYQLACGGWPSEVYPYGDFYSAGRCADNTWHFEIGGALPNCEREGVHDLSGNLEEWTGLDDQAIQTCGGSFLSGESDLTCTSCDVQLRDQVADSRGFRCCALPQMPE